MENILLKSLLILSLCSMGEYYLLFEGVHRRKCNQWNFIFARVIHGRGQILARRGCGSGELGSIIIQVRISKVFYGVSLDHKFCTLNFGMDKHKILHTRYDSNDPLGSFYQIKFI